MTRSRSLRPVELPTTWAAVSAQLAQAAAVVDPDDFEVQNAIATFTYRAKIDFCRLSRAYACEMSVERERDERATWRAAWRFVLTLDGRRVMFVAFPTANTTNEYRMLCIGCRPSTDMARDAWRWLQSRVLSAFEE